MPCKVFVSCWILVGRNKLHLGPLQLASSGLVLHMPSASPEFATATGVPNNKEFLHIPPLMQSPEIAVVSELHL